MRKWNTVITAAICLLFLLHLIVGGFQLAGIYQGGIRVVNLLARLMATLVIAHMLIGIKLTADTLRAVGRAGVSYWKENKLFWARRISALAVFLLMLYHIVLFLTPRTDGAFRLNYFGAPQLVLQILLVIAVAVHVLTNVNPFLIAFGMARLKRFAVDILLTLSALLIFAGAMFCVYYLRWVRI